MKTNKLSLSTKVLIAVLSIVLLSGAIFGVTQMMAEPTIEDLCKDYVHEIGTFKPSKLYNNEEATVVAYIENTHIVFSHDVWKDNDGDGIIKNADVYLGEDYFYDMLMTTYVMPICSVDAMEDCYIVPFLDFKNYNNVLINLFVSNNNDQGEVKDDSTYYFDKEAGILYLQKEMVDANIKLGTNENDDGELFPIRCESTFLTKDISQLNKSISVATVGLENASPDVLKHAPNGMIDYNVQNWLSGGLDIELMPELLLACLDSDDLHVWVNGEEIDGWYYDEFNGHLLIACDPFETYDIIILIESTTSVDQLTSSLQAHQASTGEIVGFAATDDELAFRNAFDGDSLFIKNIHFEASAPIEGTTEPLYFGVTVRFDLSTGKILNGDGEGQVGGHYYDGNSGDSFSKSIDYWEPIIQPIITNGSNYVYDTVKKTQWIKTGTLSAYQSALQGPYDYGNVVYDTFLLAQNDAEKDLDRLMSYVRTLTDHKSSNGTINGQWSDTSQRLHSCWYIGESNCCGIYINGQRNRARDEDGFFGGELSEESLAFFDLSCADIIHPNANELTDAYGTQKGSDDYRANATIIDVAESGDGKSGYLYVCIWSRSMNATVKASHGQRCLSFVRIPYTYNGGTGSLSILKTDEAGNPVGGAVYTVYDENGNKVDEIITLDDGIAAESIQLPAGNYYFEETTVPNGYLRDTQRHLVTIVSGQCTAQTVKDSKQQLQLTFTVYDYTTKGTGYEMPVSGLEFEIRDANGNLFDTYTTNERGQIDDGDSTKDANGDSYILIPTTGDYYLHQVNATENYAKETDSNHAEYCEKIKTTIDANPTDSGNNLTQKIVHYEQRQTISLKTHVQDINLGENSPTVLGGDDSSGSYTSLLNAQYKLKTTSEIFLGYDRGQKIIVPSGTLLDGNYKILTYDGVLNANATSYTEGDKAYIEVSGIQHNGITYGLPNGTYQWIHTTASPGYYCNGATFAIDLTWKQENSTIQELAVTDTSVQQQRQTGKLELWSKYYLDDDRTTIETNTKYNNLDATIIDNKPTVLRPRNQLNTNAVSHNWKKSVYEHILKTLKGDDIDITRDSIEGVKIVENNNTKLTVVTSGIVPNAIYELTNLYDVVDIVTGEIIPANTLLGRYKADENGNLQITQLGSAAFDSPNKETSIERVAAVSVMTNGRKSANGNALPNGVYGLSLLIDADGYYTEKALTDNVFTKLQWSSINSSKTQLYDESVAVALQHAQNEYNSIVAPDPIFNPNDPYDPLNPDDKTNNMDDSHDIGKVEIEWIDKHSKDIAYRIFDSDNITSTDNGNKFDVSDVLPVTFAFYAQENRVLDDNRSYKYFVSYYYQATQREYNSAVADGKEVMIMDDGSYAIKFDSNDDLVKHIVLNKTSDGYRGYDEVIANESVSGAVYNTSWLDERMATRQDGTYKIYVVLQIQETYKAKISLEPVTVLKEDKYVGTLTIKNRQLVVLD